MTIVAYLYQIIYFYIVLDYGATEGCTFYSSVATDKHVIANDNVTEVREMYRFTVFVTLKPEAFLS